MVLTNVWLRDVLYELTGQSIGVVGRPLFRDEALRGQEVRHQLSEGGAGSALAVGVAPHR